MTTYPIYDSVGRVLQSAQITAGQTYPFQYAYNLAGGLETLTYPSKRAVTTCSDALNRAQSVARFTGGTPYAAATSGPDPDNSSTTLQAFTAHGAPQRVVLGNGIVEAVQYNNRLQPVSISAALASTRRLKLTYGYGTANNGNVMSETIDIGGSVVLPRSYGYDALNRLQVATETGPASWQETSRYDVVGNRWVDVGMSATYGITLDQNTPTSSAWYNANNQMIGGNPDGAGNLRQVNPFTLSHDAENRIANVTETVSNSTFTVATYQYDADGRRVSKVAPSGQTVYVYDAGGDLMAEYGLVTDSGTTYLTADHLGSTRLLTDASGGVKKRYDYKPFGEELLAGTNGRAAPDYNAPNNAMPPDVMSRKFTGKERDAETGLDWFTTRYFSDAHGRFTSADLPFASQRPSDPQNWNLYSYTSNNPLSRLDPTGRNWFSIGGSWQWYEGADVNNQGERCKKGTKGCNHSDYTHLIVFQKTGTNQYGAATGTLTLYGKGYNDKVQSTAFSGGPNSPAKSNPIPNGTFFIQLLLDEVKDISSIDPRTWGLKNNYGIQTIKPIEDQGARFDNTWEWGDIRAALNHARNGNQEFQGNFLHGKNRPGDYTHGCICERSQTVLKLLVQQSQEGPKGARVPVVVK